MKHCATEQWTDERALESFAGKDEWARRIMERVRPLLATGAERPRLVEIGAAQGLTLISLAQMGYDAYGIEPWEPAIERGKRLAQSMNVDIKIERAFAEAIPYPNDFCDCVIGICVMEHTKDLNLVLQECHRILKPGGVLWFNICSSICPRQDEIAWFPCFGWYPLGLKRKIMAWAREKKPAWIGNTDAPALQWVSPWSARHALRAAGFGQIWDRWDLSKGAKGFAYRLVASNMATKTIADMCVPTLSFAAMKPIVTEADPAQK